MKASLSFEIERTVWGKGHWGGRQLWLRLLSPAFQPKHSAHFVACHHVDENRDQKQAGIAGGKPQNKEQNGDELPCSGCDDGRFDIGQKERKERAENPTSVHRKRGNRVEDNQQDIDRKQKPEHSPKADVTFCESQATFGEKNKGEEDRCDKDIHCRSSHCDHEFREWLPRHRFQACNAPDGQQDDVSRFNTEPPGRQRMAVFMEEHASEDGKRKPKLD